jgi:phosphatidyl-myo-inositol alpha-mannosyltransferase
MSTNVAMADDAVRALGVARRRFRVAVFSYGLPCPGEKRGGIEQVAHDLANALVDRGHQVTVFTYDPRPANARYDTRPLPCRTFVMTWLGRRIAMGYVGNLLALGPRYRDFDVILAHGDSLLLPLSGKPVVRVMHGSALEEARSATSFGRAALQAGVYLQELATALLQRGTVAVSANTRRFNPFIHRMIPDGIDLNTFRPDATARSASPSVLFVGALEGRKRGSWLLDRFTREVQPRFPDAELHMVTTPGPAVAGVTYHTGITTDALVRLYQYVWVYASPSTYEGFGLPYVEALACGTPVVATPNPGSREVLDAGRFGRLASDDMFAHEICGLLADPNERGNLARNGMVRASLYDIGRSAAQYEAVIDELVA